MSKCFKIKNRKLLAKESLQFTNEVHNKCDNIKHLTRNTLQPTALCIIIPQQIHMSQSGKTNALRSAILKSQVAMNNLLTMI